MKKFVYLLFLFCIFNQQVFAFDSSRANNKFGIHLAQPDLTDLKKAADLVNSNGGDFGYVTLVMQDNDRDRNKWQEVFDKMRELRIIPIIRLATHPEGAIWPRPQAEQTTEWVNFLDSLNWVIKDRYIVLFNEPNHASEWGGNVDAQNYATIAKTFAQKLKEKNPEFFVMLAGLDASAPSAPPRYEDEFYFLKNVIDEINIYDFNNLFSGWVSHSYPNPAFSGPPGGDGRGSVRTYEWERGILSGWGIKDLPVFITETGWDATRLGEEVTAQNFDYTYQNIWLSDNRIVAVTPFILNYQGEPFLKFSWIKFGAQDYYPVYWRVQALAKKQGGPEVIEKGNLKHDLPNSLVVHSSYSFKVSVGNIGQAIWDKDRGYHLELTGIDKSQYFFSEIKNLKPNQEQDVDLFIKTEDLKGEIKTKLVLFRDKEKLLESKDWMLRIVPYPSLVFRADTYPKLKTSGKDFELQIFDDHQQLVFKKSGLKITRQTAIVEEVPNIALGRKYRLVILKPYYLPRQEFLSFHKGQNQVSFKTMYPLDFSNDGKLDISDLTALFKNPRLLLLLIP